MKIRLGTRNSNLALKQCEQVMQKLQEHDPSLTFELCKIQTKGDQLQHLALDSMNGQGVFVKEIEQQLLDGSIDVGVHSLKDMPSLLDERLCFTKTILREDARDVLVLASGETLKQLAPHARIATGSQRRKVQLWKWRSDLEIVGIRGNIETRLRKMEEEGLDGIVLAAAALHRLGLQHRITHYFSEEEMIPACGQGALALEIRRDREDLLTMINACSEERIDHEVWIEREFLRHMGAGCHSPVGARCHIGAHQIQLHAMYGKEQSTQAVYIKAVKALGQAEELVREVVAALQQKVDTGI